MSRAEPVYTASRGSDGRPCVCGPGNGMGYDAGTLWPDMRLSTDKDAEAAAKIANEAYARGRESLKYEFTALMGVVGAWK